MSPTLGVFGAGSVGCYLGGCLQAGGSELRFVGRPRLQQALREHGLRLTDFRGLDQHLPPAGLRFDTDAASLADCELVLVTVKSAATEEAARTLAPRLAPGTVVVSFQNGLRNGDLLRRLLPRQIVLGGMVPFNVLQRGPGHFHCGTEGELAVERHEALARFEPAFLGAGLPLEPVDDLPGVQWAKLLLNLNNAINALSGLPLQAELSQRGYRRCLALAQQEALTLLAAAGIRPARLTPVPPRWLPPLLRVPDGLFRRLAHRMLAIDPLARSSMWEDLEAGRETEIEWLNGEIVRLAKRLGRAAPVNARLAALVQEAQRGGRRDWPAAELLAQLEEARSAE